MDRSYCTFNISYGNLSRSNTSCHQEVDKRLKSNGTLVPNIFVKAQCIDIYVEIPLTTMSMSRSNLGILVVVLDVLIIISLVLAYLYLGYFEGLEDKEYK